MGTSFPQEITDIIVDEVAEGLEPVLRVSALRACSLISHAWVNRSREYLFSKIEFDETGFRKWCASIRPGNLGPSHHVTYLRFNQEFWDPYLGDLVLANSHMSSFTNVRGLHVVNVSLQHEEIRSAFGKFGSTVSQLSLEGCPMDIHHPEPENPPKPLIKKGDIGLELRIDMIHSGRSFVYELSVLPVAELNRLLVGSRETLTYFRVLADFAWGIDLTNIDALKELELDVDHNTTNVLQTITSSRLALIVLNSNGSHHNYPNAWKRLDTALYFLIHRIESEQEPRDGGSRLHVKLFLGSDTYGCDVVEFANQLLPKCVERGFVAVFGPP